MSRTAAGGGGAEFAASGLSESGALADGTGVLREAVTVRGCCGGAARADGSAGLVSTGRDGTGTALACREEAVQLCSSLKSAGGDCVVQAN